MCQCHGCVAMCQCHGCVAMCVLGEYLCVNVVGV